MKKLLLILGLSLVVFACHTKKEQSKSGINDPVNITYNNVDESVLSSSAETTPTGSAKKVESVDSTAKTEVCIDSTKIHPEVMCTQDVTPVCGCDGKEYTNQCEAEKQGVIKWTDGPCAKKSEGKPAKKKKK